MTMPKISDVLTCGDPEYLESLCRDLLRAGFGLSGGVILMDELLPEEALHIAKRRGPCSATRTIACGDPYCACQYARDVDKGPRDDTRTAACRSSYRAYCYARDVDKGPRDDTRTAACLTPLRAHWYARYVDEGFHEETWGAVRDSQYAEEYRRDFQVPAGY